ncbi:MAG: hypothetical protein IKM54_06210 [Butyricicoccus sp.]|nr:hypothetical protein [Butyricicoccus sp.]
MNEKAKVRNPLSHTGIYRLMVTLTYLVSGAFMVKNLLGGDITGAIVVGGVLAVLTAVLGIMIGLKVKPGIRHAVVASSLIVVVFIIGLTTGTYYSEDFCLYLAVIGLTGLYLKPVYGWVQLVLSDIFLIIQFIAHPEKADPLSQFIMCMITFTLAAVMFCLVIGRGRSFIERSRMRTNEAEDLLKSMNKIGLELEQNFRTSDVRMKSLESANEQMKDSADILQQSSENIASDAYEVSASCDNARIYMQETEQNIQKLNSDVHGFEEVLAANQRNMAQMSSQMDTVKEDIDETASFFRTLTEQMTKISTATEEINQIASNTGLLAVNASIEAARAGAAGKGFAVVATNVRELAVNSTQCSNEVADLVSNMQVQIDHTSRQLAESADAITESLQTLISFQDGFTELLQQFKNLYGNIEAQNQSIEQVSTIFEGLKDRVATMSANSDQNQTSVESIAQTMRVYRENIAAVIEDNRHIQQLSEDMLSVSQTGISNEGNE